MKLAYNAPVVLTFCTLSLIVLALRYADPLIVLDWFSTDGEIHPLSLRFYFTLFSHIFGHVDGSHLRGNFMIILLVGPLLEVRHGSRNLLIMIAVTAVATGLINAAVSSFGVLGASGIAFMMLILASCVNFRRGEVPLTLILAILLYLTDEVLLFNEADNISHLGHILGGLFGGVFGLLWHPREPAPDLKIFKKMLSKLRRA